MTTFVFQEETCQLPFWLILSDVDDMSSWGISIDLSLLAVWRSSYIRRMELMIWLARAPVSSRICNLAVIYNNSSMCGTAIILDFKKVFFTSKNALAKVGFIGSHYKLNGTL